MAAHPTMSDLAAVRSAHANLPALPGVMSSGVGAQVVRTPAHAAATGVGSRSASRRILPEAGFALELLGHAIEYLADEYTHETAMLPSIYSADPRMEAMRLLMAANRDVYYACPLKEPLYKQLRERMRNWLFAW
ncbi:MAG TPA: hypothetical protein VF126_12815 [Acidobacteriaceae bacterium]